jgi:hypothetical protein
MVNGIAASVAASSLFSIQSATTAAGASATAGARPDHQTQDALAAVKTLSQAGSSAGDAAKGAAMQKLAMLKAQLKTLMMLGGDPKQRAKQAAAIAQQIAAAAAAYAQAGGDPSSLALPGAGVGTSAALAPASAAQSASGQDVPAGAPQAPQAGSASAPTPASGADPGAVPSTTPADGAAPANVGIEAGAAGQSGKSSANSSGGEPSTTPATASGGSSQMDQAFVQEARTLAGQAKAIIQAAEQVLKRQHKTSDPAISGAGDAALAAVGAAANQIDAAPAGIYASSAPAAPEPAISITA